MSPKFNRGELGLHDIVLVLGLIYHLENLVGALRVARAHTKRLCVLETQLAPGVKGTIDWGSYRNGKTIAGTFAIIDEAIEIASANAEANTTSISLVPSLDALLFLLPAVGFSRVELLPVPAGGNEQLLAGKRVMVAAYVDDPTGVEP